MTSIGYAAFYGCSSLTSITIPDSVTSIGVGAFYECSSLTSVTIGNSVTSIGEETFRSCSSLISITIPNSVISIGNQAFLSCKSLTSITIPNSVTSIGDEAFHYCKSLTSVTIPNSVTSIGYAAFYNCSSLTSVTFEGSTPPVFSENVFYLAKECPIYVPCGTKDAYVAALNVNNTIDESRVIEKLPYTYSVLTSDSTLGSVTITQEPTTCAEPLIFRADAVEGYQFAQWSDGNTDNPRSLILTQDTTLKAEFELAGYCGADSTNLTWTLVDSVLTISGTGAMANYDTMPWYNYRDLILSVVISDGVTSIGDRAFYGCSSLTSITIPNSVTSIGYEAFYDCSSLTSVTINSDAIVNNAYSSSSNISRIFGSQVTEYIIGDAVQGIGRYAFYKCSSLASITIPESVTSIGLDAFSNCSSLTSVTFEGSTPPVFSENVFYLAKECPIYVPCGTKDAYVAALNVNNTIDQSRVIEKSPYTYSIASSDSTLGSVTITKEPTCTEPVIFRADAAEGYQFTQWSDGNTDNPRSLVLTQDTTLTAEFELAGYCGADSTNLTWTLVDSVLTISGTGAMADYAYASKTPWYGHSIQSVIITDGVTSIGEKAFAYCSYLTSITIPNSVTSIGKDAFYKCSKLTSVTFEGSTPPVFSENVFYLAKECPIYVPCGTKDAYVAALNVNNTIDESRVIEKLPYTYSVLTSDSTLGSVIITQEPSCTAPLIFRADAAKGYRFTQWSDGNTDNPRSLVLTQDTTLKAEFELAQCLIASGYCGADSTNLIWELSCDSVLTIRGTGAMSNYDTMPWYNYRDLILSVVISDGVTSIGLDAFRDCSSLTSVTIPNSVTSIGDDAFYKCSSLTSVTIPNSVTSIGDDAFYKCSSLTSVTIPNSVTSIGYGAFWHCSSLPSVTIPNSVTSIGSSTFSGCSTLTSITIPNSVTSIGSSAFRNCSSLTSITIPNGVTSIGDLAFYNCSSLTSVTIPNSVTSIGDGAFYECSSLTSVTIPNSVTSIGGSAFFYCDSLTSITIPNSVTSIGERTFQGCSKLTSVTIPNSVTSIGDYAFCYCYKLTSIAIPNSVTSIGDYAFCYCISLTSVTIGNSVTSIGDDAFYKCSSLTSVINYATQPQAIETSVFQDVDISACQLHVPSTSVDLYKTATVWKDFGNIQPIRAEDITDVSETIITPSENEVEITWPAVSGAASYELVIKDKNGNIVCTLVFNANGQLTSITFNAPSRNGVPAQTQSAGFSFTVTGLDSGTGYDLTLTAKDNIGNAIQTETITFITTGGNVSTDIDQLQGNEVQSTKMIKDGQVLILRNGKTYTMQGQEVK